MRFSTWAGSAQQVGGKGASSERLGGDTGPPERLQRISSFPLKGGASLRATGKTSGLSQHREGLGIGGAWSDFYGFGSGSGGKELVARCFVQ